MSIPLRIIVVLVGVALIWVVMKTMKQKKMNAGFSLLWLFSGLIVIVLGLFPGIIIWAAGLFDVGWPPAIVVFAATAILGFISYGHTKEVSVIRAQVTELTEQVSVLKYELRESKILQKYPEQDGELHTRNEVKETASTL